jgi:hypothetical protein
MKIKFKYILLLLISAGIITSFTNARVNQKAEWREISIKEYDDIIKKASAFYETDKKAYSINVSVSSFKTHTDMIPVESQDGFVIKSGANYHHYMMGVHSFQNKQYRFVVDSVEKTIMVANPEGESVQKMLMSTYEQFHSKIQKVQMISLKEFDKVKIVLSDKMRVSHVEMEFEKNGMLRKSTSFFRVKIAENSDDPKSTKTSPRIETVFTNYKENIKVDYAKEFSEAPYFSSREGKFFPTKKFEGYYIKDTRIKAK